MLPFHALLLYPYLQAEDTLIVSGHREHGNK
jgi:hypothetical protein